MLRSGVKPGQWIVLPGAGGGLGHLAIQYARAMGMRVIAIDGGEQKRELCEKLGAEVFIDFTTTSDIAVEIMRITTYGAQGVIVTAATKQAYALAPTFLRPNGTVVVVGLPKDASILAGAPPLFMALKRLNIVGNITGSLKDVEEALDFTARGVVRVSQPDFFEDSVLTNVAGSMQGEARRSELVDGEVEEWSASWPCSLAGCCISINFANFVGTLLSWAKDGVEREDGDSGV